MSEVMLEHVALLERTIANKSAFNGKPFDHWQLMADKQVVELLVRAAVQGADGRSLPGLIAQRRLLLIAERENPDLFCEVIGERAKCLSGFSRLVSSILSKGEP